MTSQLPNPQEPNPPAPDDLATAELNELFNQHLATLRQQAAHHMGRQNKDHTLQPTALVNEVYVRLQKAGRADWEDRTHFLRVASKAMRSILVDNFRKKNSLKGGGKKEDRELDQITVSFEENGYDLEALDMALTELAVSQPLMAEAVQLRFFGRRGNEGGGRSPQHALAHFGKELEDHPRDAAPRPQMIESAAVPSFQEAPSPTAFAP